MSSGFTDRVSPGYWGLHNTNYNKEPAPQNYTIAVEFFDQPFVLCTRYTEEEPNTKHILLHGNQESLWWYVISCTHAFLSTWPLPQLHLTSTSLHHFRTPKTKSFENDAHLFLVEGLCCNLDEKQIHLKKMTETPTFASWLGPISHNLYLKHCIWLDLACRSEEAKPAKDRVYLALDVVMTQFVALPPSG